MQNVTKRNWELTTLGCMYLGYMGFILCRTALAVASPSMKEAGLITNSSYGQILGWGTAGMVTGKLLMGAVADYLGGRRVFLAVLLLTAVMAIVLSTGTTFAMLAGFNFVMLFAAAAGWPAMASIISRWYESAKLGRVWGIISTSSRLSAFLSTLFLGYLLTKFDWHYIFYVAGGMGILIAISISFFLKSSPEDVGLIKVVENEDKDEKKKKHHLDDKTMMEALITFASSGRFWLMCISLMCTTVLMEFIGFLPLYFKESFELAKGQPEMATSVFPAGCFIALLFAGFIYDACSRKGRIALLGGLLFISCLCIVVLWKLPNIQVSNNTKFIMAMTALFFFGLSLAPTYYLPMSIFSNEFGGIHCGVLIGIIDAAGYLASMTYQFNGGRLTDQPGGWQNMLMLFIGIGIVAMLSTIWFAFEDYRRSA